MAPPSPGFDVQPDVLDEGARQLDGVAGEICGAGQTLKANGGLPTLDALSKAIKIAAGCAGITFPPLMPLFVWGSGAIAGAVAEEIDPYPPIRAAWEDALERYCRMVGDDARGLRDTAEEYRIVEDRNRIDIDRVYTEPVPMPTVRPSGPTAPMPTVPPDAPPAPMPEVSSGGDGPVSV